MLAANSLLAAAGTALAADGPDTAGAANESRMAVPGVATAPGDTMAPGAAAAAPPDGSTGMRRLSDAELDAVTAGNVAVGDAEDVLSFEAVRRTASGRTVAVDGSLEVLEVPTGITVGNLVLRDGAQQNLQSVININAVNSAVNVLLNLNVTIDSSVGDINQLNLTESLPAIPAGPPIGN